MLGAGKLLGGGAALAAATAAEWLLRALAGADVAGEESDAPCAIGFAGACGAVPKVGNP